MVAIGAALILVLFCASWFFASIRELQRIEVALSNAQLARTKTLRLVLDEETGIRGYVATHNRTFLQPYLQGRRTFTRALAALSASLLDVGISSSFAQREGNIETNYLQAIAAPLVSKTPPSDTGSIELSGKHLVDAFRNTDEQIETSLKAVAAATDSAAKRVLVEGLWGGGITLLLSAAAVLWFLLVQRRLVSDSADTWQAYEAERRIVQTLQQAFIRKALPSPPNVRISARYAPATEVAQLGGDWFEVIERENGRLFFSIGDVAGHGIDAAVVMSQTRQAIVAAAIAGVDPGAVLTIANRVLALQGGQIATAIFGIYDPADSKITYASAGHPPPLLHNAAGGAVPLPAGGLPLGVMETEYQSISALAPPGSSIVLYTDGLIESRRDIFAGETQLIHAINRALGKKRIVDPAASIYDRMIPHGKQLDDVAILVLQFVGVGSGRASRSSRAAFTEPRVQSIHGNQEVVSKGDKRE